jgi:hypothetical protein
MASANLYSDIPRSSYHPDFNTHHVMPDAKVHIRLWLVIRWIIWVFWAEATSHVLGALNIRALPE